MKKINTKVDIEVVRDHERQLLFITQNTCPERPGPQSFSIRNSDEMGTYRYGVLLATGSLLTDRLDMQSDIIMDAMSEGDARSLVILARAAEDVRRARDEGISVKAKHIVSLLTSKLEFDDILGETPPKRLVIEFARRWYVSQYGMIAADKADTKAWDIYMEAAGLKYLPTTISDLHKRMIASES